MGYIVRIKKNGVTNIFDTENTIILGTNGQDLIFAGSKNNKIIAGNGQDTVYAGAGNDLVFGDDEFGVDTISNGKDTIYAGSGNDIAYGGNGADWIAGDGYDPKIDGTCYTITPTLGSILNDTGVATISAGSILSGGLNYNNSLVKGNGDDVLIGGNGPDTFAYFRTTDSEYHNGGPGTFGGTTDTWGDIPEEKWDFLADFKSGQDKIDLSMVAKVNCAPDGEFKWWSPKSADFDGAGSAGMPAANEMMAARAWGVWQDTDGKFLYVDTNGDGAADMKIQVSDIKRGDFIGVDKNDGPETEDDYNKYDKVKEAGVDTLGDPSAEGNVLSNDYDPNGDELTVIGGRAGGEYGYASFDLVVASSPAQIVGKYGILSLSKDGTWTYTLKNDDPDTQALKEGQIVRDVFTYKVTDGQGEYETEELKIKICGTNDAPVAVADTNSGFEDTLIIGNVASNDSDPDMGAVRKYSLPALSAVPAGFILNPDGSYSLDASNAAYQHIAAGASESVTVTYVVKDEFGASASSTLTIIVTGTNDGPVAEAKTIEATEGGAVITGSVVATDLDDGAVLSFSAITALPAGLTFGSNGAYSFDPAVAAYNHLATGVTETVTLEYQVSDGTDTDTAVLTIIVTGTNDGPVAEAKTIEATEGGAVITGSVVATDLDDGAVLSFSAITALPAGLTFGSNGAYSFDPAVAAYNHLATGVTETVTLEYQVSDGTDTDTAVLTIIVTGTNDGPVAEAKTIEATEGGAVITGSVVATDLDDGAVLSFSAITALPAGLTFGSNGAYSFDPAVAAYNHLATGVTETVTLEYQVSDGTDTDTAVLTIIVTGTNDGPVAEAKTIEATEGGAVITGSVVATDLDDGAVLSFSAITALPAGLTFGSNGAYSFDPAVAAYNHLATGVTETVTLEYQVSDGTDTDTAVLTIIVTGTNDGPVAEAKTIEATEGGAVITGSVVATDLDDGAVLSFSAITALPAGLTFGSNGAYSFDPAVAAYNHLATGVTETVTLEYQVSDGTDTDTAVLTIIVTGTNDGATISPVDGGDYSVVEAGGVNNALNPNPTASGTLSVVDADAGQATFRTPTPASLVGLYGTFAFNAATGAWSYELDNFNEDVQDMDLLTAPLFDELTVTSFDGTDTETIRVEITGQNDAPVMVLGPSPTISEGSSYTLDAADLGFTDVDDEADSIEFTLSNPVNGQLLFNGIPAALPLVISGTDLAAGLVRFVHNGTNTLSAGFDVSVDDDNTDGTTPTVSPFTFAVTPVADEPPIASPVVLAAIAEDSGVRVITSAQLLTGVTDPDGPLLSITSLSIAAGAGSLVNNGNGTWSYTPALNDDTGVTFNYTATDGTASSSSTASMDITPVNDAAADLIFTYTGQPGNSLPNGAFGQMSVIDPDGGGAYTYARSSLTATVLSTGAGAPNSGPGSYINDINVSATGVISASNLNDDRIYEVGVQVTQGSVSFIETFSIITGTNASNTISGAAATGDDVIFAQGQNDIILAGSGNDNVFGQSADDRISGGAGNDVLYGGGGNDTFVYSDIGDAGDLIADYGDGNDLIDLTALLVDETAATIGQFVQYNTVTGVLSVDVNGNVGGANFVSLVTVDTSSAAGVQAANPVTILYDGSAPTGDPSPF